ncbi:hypothetical protein [Streptomyces sp. NPDC006997]|uniref:hypothetical protein n=1 Tax=Streptomyces sp. NPDC006997 TaxID=3155356 RepID=UPI0033CCA986
MDQQHLSAPESAQITPREPLYGAAADRIRDQLRESSNLTVDVAQRMLAAYGNPSGYDIYAYAQAHGALAEALRILVRAVGADPAHAEREAVRRSVDAHFPTVAAFLAHERGERR